jgi:hypothetical protein
VVATSLLAKQLAWEDGAELLVGDTSKEFAAQCARLYSDRELWDRIRVAALARLTLDCDPMSFNKKVAAVLRSVGVYPPRMGSSPECGYTMGADAKSQNEKRYAP